MKLFLIISDTHGDLYKAKRVILQYPQINGVIHLGDYCRDARMLENQFKQLEFHMVSGNCDFSVGMKDEETLDIEGKKILLTHGHNYHVKYGTERLESKAADEGLDVVLFGHTHVPLLNQTPSLLLLNPGSIGYPRGMSPPTYALLEISGGMVEARILDA